MDHYRVLSEKIEGTDIENLGPYSTQEAIKSNYRKLAQYYHPDKHMNNPLQKLAEEKLKDINIAYQILSDPIRRRDYDERRGGTPEPRPKPAADKQNILYRNIEPGSVVRESITITNAGGPYTKVHIAKPIDPQIQISGNVLTAGKQALPLKIDITMRAGTYGSIIQDEIKVYVDDDTVTIPVRLETKPAAASAKTSGNGAASGKEKGGRIGKGMIALIAGLGVILAGLIVLIVILASLPPTDEFTPVKTLPSDTKTGASKPPAKSPAKKTPSPVPTTPQPTPTPSVATSPAISFADVNLENAIRSQMNKPHGDILQSDAEKILSLNLHAENISDITPLKYFRNLKELDLGDNSIKEISPLSGLTQLNVLRMQGNGIQDISALSTLTNLTYLDLSDNEIKDITALDNLENPESLMLQHNQIQDVSTLAELTSLKVLLLGGNPISDYTPVQGLNLTSKDF